MSNEATRRGKLAGTAKLVAVMVGSIAMSAAGVLYAVCWGVAADAGRGGALAVALTFFTLFAGRGTPERALESDFGTGDAADSTRLDVIRLRAALASMLDWQSKEKIYLTASSVIGTIAWGFGDWIAVAFGAR